MKSAITYLKAAIGISHQCMKVMTNTFSISDDLTLTLSTAPLSPELNAVLVATSLSSAATDLVNLKSNTNLTTPPPAADAKGTKAKKNSVSTPAPVSNGVGTAPSILTVRDAMLLQSSTSREADIDPFWCDGYPHDLNYDLNMLLQSYPVYTKYTALTTVPSPVYETTDETAANVPDGSVSVVWSITDTASQYTNLLSSTNNNNVDVNVVNDDSTTTQRKQKEIKDSIFPNIIGYFLIGSNQNNNSTPLVSMISMKGNNDNNKTLLSPTNTTTTNITSSDFELIKLILDRYQILHIEQTLRDLLMNFKSPLNNNNGQTKDMQINKSIGKKFGDILSMITVILGRSIGLERSDPKVEIIAEGDVNLIIRIQVVSSTVKQETVDGVSNVIAVPLDDDAVTLPVTEKVIADFADILSCTNDTNALVNSDICNYLRCVLGCSGR